MATSTYHNIMRNMQKRAKAEAKAEVQAEMQAKSEELVTTLIRQTGFDNDKIANLASVTLEFVQTIREKLGNSQ
jgi:hypothetical protein